MQLPGFLPYLQIFAQVYLHPPPLPLSLHPKLFLHSCRGIYGAEHLYSLYTHSVGCDKINKLILGKHSLKNHRWLSVILVLASQMLAPPFYRSYIQIWKLHISEVTHFSFFTLRVDQHCRQCKVFVGLGSFQNRKKRGLENYSRLLVSPGGLFVSLHGQPYPAAPQKLLHVQQVDSQSSFQLLTQPLLVPAVCAVHGHAQEWHQQEEASEQGKVGAGWSRLIGWEQKRAVYWAAVNEHFSSPVLRRVFPALDPSKTASAHVLVEDLVRLYVYSEALHTLCFHHYKVGESDRLYFAWQPN